MNNLILDIKIASEQIFFSNFL